MATNRDDRLLDRAAIGGYSSLKILHTTAFSEAHYVSSGFVVQPLSSVGKVLPEISAFNRCHSLVSKRECLHASNTAVVYSSERSRAPFLRRLQAIRFPGANYL